MNIYKVKNEYLSVLDKLNNIEDLSPEIIKDTLAPYEDEANTATLIAGTNIKNLEIMKLALSEYVDEMQERIRKTNESIQDYKNYIKDFMRTRNIRKITGIEFDISIKDSNSAVDVHDLDLIPEEYKKTTISISADRNAIRKAIQSGKDVPGASLSKSQSLTIK